MTTLNTLKLIQILMAIAIFFQTLEYLALKASFSENGVWRWSEIRAELQFLPNNVQAFFNFFLNDRHFIVLLWIRLLACITFIIFPSFYLILFLFLSSLLIAQRFRGSFNGGSDYMSLIVLSALLLERFFHHPIITKGVLWYIAIQSVTSYFIAGIVKIKQSSWRNGYALEEFITSPNYNPPRWIKKCF